MLVAFRTDIAYGTVSSSEVENDKEKSYPKNAPGFTRSDEPNTIVSSSEVENMTTMILEHFSTALEVIG